MRPAHDSARAPSEDLASLLRRSAAGDATAFAAVYDATAARAVGLAAQVLQDPAQAELVAADAYLHVWTHAGSFDPDRGSAIAWILATVHDRAVRRLRSARVPPEQRPAGQDPLELAYFGGHTVSEVARLCDIAPETASARIRGGLHSIGGR